MGSNSTSDNTSGIFFRWRVSPIKDGKILSLFSGGEIKVIVAIAAHLDENNTCYPTLGRIAHLTGYNHGSTVSKIIGRLKNKKIEGSPILRIEKHRSKDSRYTNNLYYLSPEVGIEIFKNKASSNNHSSFKHYPNGQHKDTQIPKDTQKEKEEPRGMGTSFKEKGTAGNTLTPVSNLFASSRLPTSKDLTVEISKVASTLSRVSKKPLPSATRIVKSHIALFGHKDWNNLYHKFLINPEGIRFYNAITYKVKQQKMLYQEALKQWDSEQ